MKLEDMELHPEEAEKVDECPGGYLQKMNENLVRAIDRAETSDETIPDDPIHHPTHYTHYKGLEVIQLTEQMNFNRGNAVKYIARAGIKDQSKEIEDLEKAKWYIQREIDRLKGDN